MWQSVMQTFLSYSDFYFSADVLDYRRLGKQRLEGRDCYVVCTEDQIEGVTDLQYYYIMKRFKNHPIVKMWTGYEECLKLYTNIIIDEWINRGYVNNIRRFDIDNRKLFCPDWLGNEAFHSSHRAALLAKNYDWYSQFGWSEEPKIDYVWII